MAFQFISDPDHGWLRVTAADFRDLGLMPFDFTRYSYVDHRAPNGPVFYLEEDCDAPRFIQAWERKHGCQIIISELTLNHNSPIRGMAHIHHNAASVSWRVA